MKRAALYLAMAIVTGCVSAPDGWIDAEDGKNVYDIRFGELKDAEWNGNFRPYGTSSAWLWTDSNVVRGAADGKSPSDRRRTSLRASCDEGGFAIEVRGTEPSLGDYLARTNDYPSSSIEYFVAPGDADHVGVQQRYMCYYGDGVNREYPNREPDHEFRLAKPTVSETAKDGETYVTIRYDWASFWDRLPVFGDRADNFWRLSVIRWVEGGMTWGGTVHQNSQAGYVRWPDFTEAQKGAVMKTTLEKGWREFCKLTRDNTISIAAVTTNWVGATEARRRLEPRSFVNLNEDPDFRPTLERMIAERRALAPQIATMDTLSPIERDRFYRRASKLLFGFPWALQSAYREYELNRIFNSHDR